MFEKSPIIDYYKLLTGVVGLHDCVADNDIADIDFINSPVSAKEIIMNVHNYSKYFYESLNSLELCFIKFIVYIIH